jgi:hypothetical protein
VEVPATTTDASPKVGVEIPAIDAPRNVGVEASATTTDEDEDDESVRKMETLKLPFSIILG